MDAALEAAYRAARYRVGKVALRVGERAPELDALLESRGLVEWAFLTAHNPGSVPRADVDNAAAQRRLLERLAGYPLLLGHAESPDGAWREASVLALGLARDEARTVAAQFGQLAFLAAPRGSPVELVWT